MSYSVFRIYIDLKEKNEALGQNSTLRYVELLLIMRILQVGRYYMEIRIMKVSSNLETSCSTGMCSSVMHQMKPNSCSLS